DVAAACLRVDPVFDFFQVRDYPIERRSFAKEHLAHVPVVASNLSDVGVWRAYPKACRPSQIVPRPSFPEEDLFALYHACQQTDVRDRKLPVVVPVQTGEVIVVPREAGRHLARIEDSME